MKTIGTLSIGGSPLNLVLLAYRTGGPAIQLALPDGTPYCTVSVNIPDIALAEGEIAMKTYNENEMLRAPLLATGVFEDTGRRVPCGFVDAEVWRFKH